MVVITLRVMKRRLAATTKPQNHVKPPLPHAEREVYHLSYDVSNFTSALALRTRPVLLIYISTHHSHRRPSHAPRGIASRQVQTHALVRIQQANGALHRHRQVGPLPHRSRQTDQEGHAPVRRRSDLHRHARRVDAHVPPTTKPRRPDGSSAAPRRSARQLLQ